MNHTKTVPLGVGALGMVVTSQILAGWNHGLRGDIGGSAPAGVRMLHEQHT